MCRSPEKYKKGNITKIPEKFVFPLNLLYSDSVFYGIIPPNRERGLKFEGGYYLVILKFNIKT